MASREGYTVRLLGRGSGSPVGIGFVVGERHIVTCAHVVNAALGRPPQEQGKPGPESRVQVDFPILGDADGAPLRSCRIEAWQPPPEHGGTDGDVAGLVLVGEGLPVGAAPARLADSANLRDVTVTAFGYPGDPPQWTGGTWSAYRLRGPVSGGVSGGASGSVSGGVIRLDRDSESVIRTQPGYSGSPAVIAGEAGDTVVGMMAVARRNAGDVDAYAIPVSQLVAAWRDVLADLTVPDCPYRGLRSFTAQDAAAGLFVGREDEVARLRLMVEQDPLVLVTGPSGVGKSSLVGAGLLPALTREGWATATFRPGGTPFESLAKALLELEKPGQVLTVDDLNRRVHELLTRGLDRIGPQLATIKGEVLLFADQLEEILDPVTCTRQERDAFLDLVLRASVSGRLHIVCTLRADFFSQLLEHPGVATAIQNRLFPMSPMTREQLERIIVEPAHARGVRYESGLAQLITREAAGRGSLPMLEFALTELWPHQRRRQITLAEYQVLGGVTGALTQRADEVYLELSQRYAEVRIRRVLLTMVRSRQGASEATRRVALREQLGADWEVAKELAKRRLVVLDHDLARHCDTAELAHEALIQAWPRLRAWVDSDADFQRWLASMEERSPDDLLSEARIGEADRWLTERLNDISKEVVLLVTRSKSDWLRRITELQEARARAEQAAYRAEKAAREAEARRLAAAAELTLAAREVSLQIPVALAVESLRTAALLEGDIAARHAVRRAARNISRLDHDGAVWVVVFSPDGSRIATASDDRTARVFDATSGTEMSRLEHDGAVRAVVFSPDGSRIATASDDRTARVFDATSGTEVSRLDYDGAVRAVIFSPDGTRVATTSFDHTARVFDATAGTEMSRLDHGGTVRAVGFSPDGSRIATASEDGSARVFDTLAGTEICRLEHSSPVWAVAFSPDGTRVATASFDHNARVFDATAGTEICRLKHGRPVLSVVFSPDGTQVATASFDHTARVFDATAGTEICRLDHGGTVRAVGFSPDGSRIATASEDGSARVFNPATGAEITRLDHGGNVLAVVFSPDGTRVATASEDGNAWVFDADTGAETSRMDHGGTVLAVAFSPGGAQVVTASEDGNARVFDAATGTEMSRMDHGGTVLAVAFSPGGAQVVTASEDGNARVFDAATGTEMSRMDHGGTVLAVAFSPGGAQVVTASEDGNARVFDAATGTEMSRMDHGGTVLAVAFRPGGAQVVTAGFEGGARVFDAATGTEMSRMGHDDTVRAVAFSPDGARVVTGGDDCTARVFDAATGTEMSRMDHDDTVRAVAFSPDGARVVTGGDDRTARVFDAVTGAERCRMDHDGTVRAVAFSPDGARVVTGGDDRTARSWVIDPDLVIEQAEGRLIRNFTRQEWRRFFRDMPRRGIRPDLP